METLDWLRSGALVAPRELNVEVSDEGMDVVVAFDLQAEGWGEGQVFKLHGVDVHLLDEAWTADQLLGVHHIHERFFDGHFLDAGHIKAIDILPP